MCASCVGFFQAAAIYGLEKDDDSLDRLRFTEGKPRPTDEEIKKFLDSTESFGITQVEFSSEKRLAAQLKKLLGD